MSAAGPYDRWPLGRGFERYYGFLGGDTISPIRNCPRQLAGRTRKTPEEGYHVTQDLVEKAKAMIADTKQVAPNKPFFLYLALGGDAPSAPASPRSGPIVTSASSTHSVQQTIQVP